MTSLHRVLIGWSGQGIVGTAVNVLHYSASDNSTPPVAAIKAAFTASAGALSANQVITIPGSGDTIDDRTGELLSVWSATGGGTVPGMGTGNCVAGVGGVLGWTTGGIVNGRKLRGRTFISPLDAAAWDQDGTLKPQYLTYLQNLGNALMAAGPLAVWHRPTTKGGSDGNSYGVISCKVRDKAAYLSSRRD